jgi:hypothetical protein
MAFKVGVTPHIFGDDPTAEVTVFSRHKAFADMCSDSDEIDPTKTFETWIGPIGSQSPLWNLVMDAREYGDLPANLFPQLPGDTPPRPLSGGTQSRRVATGLSPLAVYSKDGQPVGDPDNTWDLEHTFDTAFAGSPEINKGKVQSVSINSTDPENTTYKFRLEIQYEVPMPAELTEETVLEQYQYDVDIRVGDGDWADVHEVDTGQIGTRGIFLVTPTAEGSINEQITIRVQRQKWQGTGWVDSGNPEPFYIAWDGNCLNGGPM